MAVTNARYGGSASGTDWQDPNNVLQSADYAWFGVPENGVGNPLYISNFGFNIPSGSTILGLEMKVSGKAGASNRITDYHIGLRSGTYDIGDNKAKTTEYWPVGTPATRTYGSETDGWGASLTPSIVNASDFGMKLTGQNNNDATYQAVYYVTIQIWYTVPPTVTTGDVWGSSVSEITANGNVTDDGGATVTERGFCYLQGTSGDPTTSDSIKKASTGGAGTYSATITGLATATYYRVRAYAINNQGTSYGSTVTVQTDDGLPSLDTNAVDDIDDTSVTGNGNVTDDNGTTITRRGFCYLQGTTGYPTTADSVAYEDGSFGVGAYSLNIPSLSQYTDYRVRAYAVNEYGTAYGGTVDVKTLAGYPTVDTNAASDITKASATLNGNITSLAGAPECTTRGFCYIEGTSGDPTTGDGTVYDTGSFGVGAYTKPLSGLTAATHYRIRAYTINLRGTGYGTTVDLLTSPDIPTVVTQTPADETTTSITGYGNITDINGATVTRRGFCYIVGTTGDPTITDSVVYEDGSFETGAYSKLIDGLTPDTDYRIRAYAVNSAGTGYGVTYQAATKATTPDAPTNVQASGGTYTDKVVITWTKATGATGYQVYRDGVPLGWLGDVATHDDPGADAPVITPGNTDASDGAYSDKVTLALSGASVADGTSHVYKVRARNSGGESPDSGTASGHRGHGALTYQWRRSEADANADYGDIVGATTATYDDTGAPA